MSVPEPQSLSESHTSPLEAEETSPLLEATAPEAVPEEVLAAPETAHQPESVFAHEGFWNGSAPGEVAASAEVPLNVDLEIVLPAAEDENLDESSKPPEEWISAWKALLRIGSVLPWMAKTLPAARSGRSPTTRALRARYGRTWRVCGWSNTRFGPLCQDHTLQLKRMDEQLGRIRESLESKSSGLPIWLRTSSP